MEFIDKNKSKEWAHELIGSFLEERLRADGEYPSDLYSSFKSDSRCKQPFVDRLMQDSGGICCYCMGKIKGPNIEHVILNSIQSKEEFNKYLEISSKLDTDNICYAKDFIENRESAPPYPHTIAYENLVPSCYGYFPRTGGQSMTCNEKRGNAFVHPIVFIETIAKDIIYKSDGTVEWSKDPGDSEDGRLYVDILGLNYIDLRMMRFIWYCIDKEGLDHSIANREKILRIAQADLDDEEDSSKEMLEAIQKLREDDYWKLLDKYEYFNDINKFTIA